MEFSGKCPHCAAFQRVCLTPTPPLPQCMSCAQDLMPWPSDRFTSEEALAQCPICACPHLYKQKDFNRNLGVAILVVGILTSYFTYGISLVAVTFFDWWLYRRVGEVGCCYQCSAQFRDSKMVSQLEPFSLILHDHYRSRSES